ncbi:MAG: 6-carboxytetrahydropterin synthase QueD [Candidatus Omnitrophica bacterium]|nr:6-carboxytetrahydropterin synthase QueD [Candidatus Omnitrophota bacterium]MDD5592805.1 6-carboxytetrahydropterin synthase QueD [Candidatus Omnitrophota bacterium]
MYSIKIESYFSSAHYLRAYKGKCEELHGHNWKVEVSVEAEKLDKAGMILDFHDLKLAINMALEKLDHKCLNHIAYFRKFNPTSENIAQYIYKNLKSKVKGLKLVTVWESHNSCASYYEI